MNVNELELRTQLRRLSREYVIELEKVHILYDYVKDIYRCEDYCILLEEGESWENIIKDLKEYYGG